MKKLLLLLTILGIATAEPTIAITRKNNVSKHQIKRQKRETKYQRRCNRIFQQHLQTSNKNRIGGYFSIAYENFKLRPQRHGLNIGFGR